MNVEILYKRINQPKYQNTKACKKKKKKKKNNILVTTKPYCKEEGNNENV